MLPVILSPEAEIDLSDAYVWYESQVSGLGEEFIIGVDASIHTIRRNPEIFQVVHRDIRRSLMRRFPFGIFFIIEPDHIRVLAVFHAHRDPKIWGKKR